MHQDSKIQKKCATDDDSENGLGKKEKREEKPVSGHPTSSRAEEDGFLCPYGDKDPRSCTNDSCTTLKKTLGGVKYVSYSPMYHSLCEDFVNGRVQPHSQSSRGSRRTRKNIGSNKCTGASVCRKPEVQIIVLVHELSPDLC